MHNCTCHAFYIAGVGMRGRKAGFTHGFLSLLFVCGASFAVSATNFQTTTFDAKLKLADNRTGTVDETIQIIIPQGATGGINNLVLAEAMPGKDIQYLVSRASIRAGGAVKPLTVTQNAHTLIASIDPKDLPVGTVVLNVNYSFVGAYVDRSGKPLGQRSTLTWNIIPLSWPSAIDKSSIQVEYPTGLKPVYVAGVVNPGGTRIFAERTGDADFVGSIAALSAAEANGSFTVAPQRPIGAQQGLRVIVALPSASLKPEPAKLTLASTTPIDKPQAKPETTPVKPTSTVPVEKKETAQPTFLTYLLPLIPPVLFLGLYWKKFRFQQIAGYPTADPPAKLGPAESAFFLEGELKPRHIFASATSLVDRGWLGKAGEGDLTPLDQKLLAILKEKGTDMSMEEFRAIAERSKDEFEHTASGWLSLQGFVQRKRFRLMPAASLLVVYVVLAIFLAGVGTTAVWSVFGIGLATSLFLATSLRPLTDKGMRCLRRIAGLRKFLRAEAAELKKDSCSGHLRDLRPYALAFGVIDLPRNG